MTAAIPVLAFGGISTQQYALIAALVLALFVLFRIGRQPRQGSPKAYRREIDAATARTTATKKDMEQLMIQLDELARTINSQIDTKFARLEHSIREADRRIAALRILLDAARSAGASLGHAELLPACKEADATTANAAPENGASPGSRNQRIYELADKGLNSVDIARQLDEYVGEVDLILNLRAAAGPDGWPTNQAQAAAN